MKPSKHQLVLVVLALALGGCGPSAAERAAQERQRLELEEKARREAEAANKAITEMNQKLGRKPPPMDLGVPSAPKPGETKKP